ncbi:MAG: YifB family Mg chelatase-like AAA ATPase [Anaerovoracaceae bacterium]|nr:YifB family Mg chelatase-like AAA ATPase [Anaerovoracaceae bacterium]
MFTRIKTATLEGVEGTAVTVETDVRMGLPSFRVVGLADTTIKEAGSRIKPAILNSGLEFPDKRVTVNLVPAGRHKEGTHFDLPIAVALMDIAREPEDTAFLGELSLDGRLNSIKGALPLVLCLRKNGIRRVILPSGNAEEASVLEDIEILAADSLEQVVKHIRGIEEISVYTRRKRALRAEWDVDFSQVIGQEAVKRAVTISAAGKHGILMMGGPGCGKTMIARRIPTILPELTYDEKLEITGVYSVAGMLTEEQPVIDRRPFRGPHHTVTVTGLLGGGIKPRPGEMSLAHKGVLFLDELGEFDSKVIDAMRQPAEEGVIRLMRNSFEVAFPADVMIVAAANPCKCGYLWDDRRICTCSPKQLDSYKKKLNGPFSDRIDMHIKMSPVEKEIIEKGIYRQKAMSSEDMRIQVQQAVEVQKLRYAGTRYTCNGGLDEKGLEEFCSLDSEGTAIMSAAYDKLGLSMRACSRLIKVARTIADMEGSRQIRQEHMAESLIYRISEGERERL